MMLPDRSELEDAAAIVYRTLQPTPQHVWPLLAEAFGAQVWLKHENHLPTGAFKVRGGLVYCAQLRRREPGCAGVVSATRGNHGQSIGLAAARVGLKATIYIPHGNSSEKNAAMRALGVELIEHGRDFQAAREEARRSAEAGGMHFIPAFHRDLVRGVATYWTELFRAAPDLAAVFVPIGMGSGITACIAAREAIGLKTRIIGVVSSGAPCYALSFRAGRPIEAEVSTQLVDGLACRLPDEDALDLIRAHVDDVVCVDDAEVAAAMRLLFSATHNVAEGAGAAAVAAAYRERQRFQGQAIGLPLTGGNIDRALYATILAESWAS